MAHLDTGGYAPVLILGDAEWLTVRAVAAGGRVPDDRVARRLRRSGILDDDGIAPQAVPALHGAAPVASTRARSLASSADRLR